MYVDYLFSFDLMMYRDSNFLDTPGNNKNFKQSMLRDCTLTLYSDADKINDRNLSDVQHNLLNVFILFYWQLMNPVASMLEPMTVNKHTIKDSFSFAEKVSNFHSNL